MKKHIKKKLTRQKPKLFDLVEVEWNDASSDNGRWLNRDDLGKGKTSEYIVCTYGLLTESTKKAVEIHQQYSPTNEKFSCSMTIPRGMVRKIIVIESNPCKIK